MKDTFKNIEELLVFLTVAGLPALWIITVLEPTLQIIMQ